MKRVYEIEVEKQCKESSGTLADLVIALLNNKIIPDNWIGTVIPALHGHEKDLFIEGSDP